MQLERHPLSKEWPDIPPAQFEELRDDIRAHGQRYPILTYGGMILDGWHRYRACTELDIRPKIEKWSGTPAAASALVISLNAHRRNVSESQRAFGVTGCCNWAESQGAGVARATPPSANTVKTNAEMASLAQTSQDTIIRAKKVHESGSAALKKAVQSGDVSVKKAASVVELPKSEQLAAAKAKSAPKADEPDGSSFDDDEAASDEAYEKEYAASIDKVMAATDKLAAAHAEIKRQAAEIAQLKLSRDGYMNGKHKFQQLLEAEQRKTVRLEKRARAAEDALEALQKKPGANGARARA